MWLITFIFLESLLLPDPPLSLEGTVTRVKCFILNTALFLASRTVLATYLSLKEFLIINW